MSLSAARFIGLRYITSKRSNSFLSFVSVFAIGGMALGVFALIVVLSVMNGFDHELKQRLLRAVPHGYLSERDGLDDWRALAERISSHNHVVASAPYIGGNALISARSMIKGAKIQGVSPVEESDVSPIADFFLRGQMSDLESGEFGIVLGSLLAHSMGAHVGDKIVVTLPKVSISLAGVFPRSRQFKVVGVFEVGAQVDQSLALMHIDDAAKLFRRGDMVDGLRIRFDDLYDAPGGMQSLQQKLGDAYVTKDWSETQGSLFRAVKLEKTVTGILLSIVIAVAAFNIITSLIMMVTEKKSDIAVLRTMGMSRKGVMMIFITQGGISSGLGILFGVCVGVPVAIYLPSIVEVFERLFGFQAFDPTVYYVTQLPSLWQPSDTFVVCGFAVFSALLSSIYPAYRATLIEPAEAMRYDA